jgi:hypothetical protein
MGRPTEKMGLLFPLDVPAIMGVADDLEEGTALDGFTMTNDVSSTMGSLTTCTNPSDHTMRKESTRRSFNPK